MTDEDTHPLKELFPEGVPTVERAMWRLLADEERAEVLRRGRAMVRYIAEGGVREGMEELGLGKTVFFRLVGRWRDKKSIAALTDVLRPRETVGRGGSADAGLRTRLCELTMAHPDWSRQALVEEIRRTVDSRLSGNLLRPLLDRIAVVRAAIDAGGRPASGREVLIAPCPVVVRARSAEGAAAVAMAAFVFDIPGRRVLGAAASTGAAAATREAAARAAAFCTTLERGRRTNGVPRVTVVLDDRDEPEENLLFKRKLDKLDPAPTTEEVGGRSEGDRALAIVGPRLGLIDLAPRMPMEELRRHRYAKAEMPDFEVVDALLVREMDRRVPKWQGTLPLATDAEALVRGLEAIAR